VQEAVRRRRAGLLRAGVSAGLVAAAAILGALVVYARRDGVAVFEPDLGPPVGAALHVLICVVWGVLFAIVAGPWRGLRVLGAAIVISVIAWLVSANLAPTSLQLGNDLYASMPRAAVVHTLMTLGLVVGMRLAQP
jgi:hypothetical protein